MEKTKEVLRIKIDEAIREYNENSLESEKMDRYKLAEKAGCTYSTLFNLNSGRVGKSTQVLSSIAQVLGVTLDEIVKLKSD